MNPNMDTDYWMGIVEKIAQASTCRVKIGTIIVHKNIIVGMGYVGSVSSDNHCEDSSCFMVDNNGLKGSSDSGKSCERTIHAELNAVLKCTVRGNKQDGWLKAFMTYSPCLNCFKVMLTIGVRNFIYKYRYKDLIRDQYIKQLNIELYNNVFLTQWS